MEIAVEPATERDNEAVQALSRSMDLDMAHFSIAEFLTAKRVDEIVGFGRLRNYKGFREIATVGVLPQERGKGIGSKVVNRLVHQTKEDIYLTCVIPDFFSKLGFIKVTDFPAELIPKYDFCRSFGYSKDQVFVMKYSP